jgi:hypothetical protein
LPYLAAGCIHLLLVAGVGGRDMVAAMAQGGTILSESGRPLFERIRNFIASSLGEGLPKSNPWRQSVALYLNAAGTESGYGFFAPHVPGSYHIVFELRYPDGRIEREEPHGDASGSEMRLASLVDLIGRMPDPSVRDGIIRLLAEDEWHGHDDASEIRVIFGRTNFPRIGQYEQGARESYHVISAFDARKESGVLSRPTP